MQVCHMSGVMLIIKFIVRHVSMEDVLYTECGWIRKQTMYTAAMPGRHPTFTRHLNLVQTYLEKVTELCTPGPGSSKGCASERLWLKRLGYRLPQDRRVFPA